jgi:predicted nucleic acid-binding protein
LTGPVLVDVNIPMYAAGQDHPLRAPAQRLVLAIANGELEAVTDVEVLQEILHRFLPLGERARGLQVFDHFQRLMAGRVLAITEADALRARALAEAHPGLPARDLVHLAVMQGHDIEVIATADRHFDGIEGITRLDPQAF